jgi:hypothetical protein
MSGRLTPEEAVPQIEEFWDLPHGYFYRLRRGDYDPGGAQRFEALLNSIDFGQSLGVPRRLVALIWTVPTFMEWQIERVTEVGGDVEALKRDVVRLRNALNNLLGAP